MLRCLAAAGFLAIVPGLDLSGSPAPGAVVTWQADLPRALLRFTDAAPEQLERSGFQYACVGAFVAARRAVTAAHCLTGREEKLTVACEGRSGEVRVATAPVVAQEQHPTHDITLLEFGHLVHCDPVPLVVASQIGSTDILFVVEPGGQGSPVVRDQPCDLRRTVSEVARTVHTIEVLDRRRCMTRGDSGTPLLIQRAGAAPAMIGLLIGGSDDQPGNQTYVRLEGIRGWIEERL